MTTPGALEAIAEASRELGDEALVGAGSVLDAATARAAILAGARFIFSPVLNLEVIEMAHRYDCVAVPGALTPTEILTAWSAGADVVKVFPANHFGPQYLRDIHGPMPQVKLTPTGGVDLTTAADWIKAGAVAVGVGSSLVKKDLIAGGSGTNSRRWPSSTSTSSPRRSTMALRRGALPRWPQGNRPRLGQWIILQSHETDLRLRQYISECLDPVVESVHLSPKPRGGSLAQHLG